MQVPHIERRRPATTCQYLPVLSDAGPERQNEGREMEEEGKEGRMRNGLKERMETWEGRIR